ncbi:MAG: hypothetical protein COA51_09485 [Idiomarina sp.]|nr:MAG: hypothetical protein COA51_09485 [Idiomarina sp.]
MLRQQVLTLSFVVMSAAGCATVAAQAQQSNLSQRDALKQELEVMNSIFETKLSQRRDEGDRERPKHFRSQRLSFDYLAGQGVVYHVNFERHFNFDFDFDFDAPMPPDAPLPEIIIEKRVVNNGSEEIEKTYRNVTEAGLAVGELVRELQEQRRQVRDLEFAMNSAEGDGRKQIEKELAEAREELATVRATLDKQRQQLRAASSEVQAKQQQRLEARTERLHQEVLAFEQTLAETLCTYGATLKSLPSNENISFVLQGAGDKDSGGNDKVYIFDKQMLVDCQNNNSSSDLLSKAVTYSF